MSNPQHNEIMRDDKVNDNTGNIVGVRNYVGYLLLFNIPVIGWIICIISAVTAKNLNIRNLARATLVFIVFLIMLVYIVYYISFRVLEGYITRSDSVSDFTWRVYYILNYSRDMKLSDMFYLLTTYY